MPVFLCGIYRNCMLVAPYVFSDGGHSWRRLDKTIPFFSPGTHVIILAVLPPLQSACRFAVQTGRAFYLPIVFLFAHATVPFINSSRCRTSAFLSLLKSTTVQYHKNLPFSNWRCTAAGTIPPSPLALPAPFEAVRHLHSVTLSPHSLSITPWPPLQKVWNGLRFIFQLFLNVQFVRTVRLLYGALILCVRWWYNRWCFSAFFVSFHSAFVRPCSHALGWLISETLVPVAVGVVVGVRASLSALFLLRKNWTTF